MRLSTPIYKLKHLAKRRARERSIPLHAALNGIARDHGFQSWSHLASAHVSRPADQIAKRLEPGDMMLIGARPGHGKTMLALDLARFAGTLGRQGVFFTLDYTEDDVQARLGELAPDAPGPAEGVLVDTSDQICAEYIIARLRAVTGEVLAVVDYLQLLDQKRSHPDLETQIVELRDYARATGAIIVVISQIDRRFEQSDAQLPSLSDVRLPNPLNLGHFNKHCFLHDGEIRLDTAA